MKNKYPRLGIDRLESWLKANYPEYVKLVRDVPYSQNLSSEFLNAFCESASEASKVFDRIDQRIEESPYPEQDTMYALSIEMSTVTGLEFCRSMIDWKRSKQSFVFDPTLVEALNLDDESRIGISILGKLPYKSFYMKADFDGYDGYLVDITEDSIIVLGIPSDIGDGDLAPFMGLSLPIPSDDMSTLSSLMESHDERSREILEDYKAQLADRSLGSDVKGGCLAIIDMLTKDDNDRAIERKHVGKMLAMLVYIASKDPEIELVYDRKHGKRKKPQANSTRTDVHEVGFRIGKSLSQLYRSTRYADCTNESDAKGKGRPKSTHIRRAHWHTYWKGPKGGEREQVVHWVPPIVVNGSAGDLRATVHFAD